MRVMGIRGELTGPCLAVGDDSFTMDVDGEDFGADVVCRELDKERIKVGAYLFVVGRVSLTHFDPKKRRVFVQAERIDVLTSADDPSLPESETDEEADAPEEPAGDAAAET